jgi:hypothetical protein
VVIESAEFIDDQMHMCACEACAQLRRDRCPVCRGPIELTTQVFT